PVMRSQPTRPQCMVLGGVGIDPVTPRRYCRSSKSVSDVQPQLCWSQSVLSGQKRPKWVAGRNRRVGSAPAEPVEAVAAAGRVAAGSLLPPAPPRGGGAGGPARPRPPPRRILWLRPRARGGALAPTASLWPYLRKPSPDNKRLQLQALNAGCARVRSGIAAE